MGFGVAMAGLKAALIPMLVKRQTAGPGIAVRRDIRRVAARVKRGCRANRGIAMARCPAVISACPLTVVVRGGRNSGDPLCES